MELGIQEIKQYQQWPWYILKQHIKLDFLWIQSIILYFQSSNRTKYLQTMYKNRFRKKNHLIWQKKIETQFNDERLWSFFFHGTHFSNLTDHTHILHFTFPLMILFYLFSSRSANTRVKVQMIFQLLACYFLFEDYVVHWLVVWN